MDDVARHLIELETAIARRIDPGVPGGLGSLLDDEFFEFGGSGRRWTRDEVVGMLTDASGRDPRGLGLGDFEARWLADDVVLLTYTSTAPEGSEATLRTSIWKRRSVGWRLAFHQGTHQAARASTTPR